MEFTETAASHRTALHSFPMGLLLPEGAVTRDSEVGKTSYIPLSSIRWDYWLTSAVQLRSESKHLAVRLRCATWG